MAQGALGDGSKCDLEAGETVETKMVVDKVVLETSLDRSVLT